MSSIRDAVVVLVLLLLAATIRIDQPVTASVVPTVEAAGPVVDPVAMPATQTMELPVQVENHKLCKVRVVSLGRTQRTTVIGLDDLETRFVVVGPTAPLEAPRPALLARLG